jgi:DNA-binding MarR family transcriptional regulator
MDCLDTSTLSPCHGVANAALAKATILQRIRVALSKISIYNQVAKEPQSSPSSLIEQQILTLLLASQLHSMFRSSLVRALDVCCPSLDDVIQQLVTKGLIHVQTTDLPSKDVLLTLEPAGALAAHRLIQWPHVLDSVLESLCPSTLEELYAHLLHTILQLQEAKQIPTSLMCITCRHFRPRQYPENPEKPHHCAFVDAPFGDRDLQIDCPEHSGTDLLPRAPIN